MAKFIESPILTDRFNSALAWAMELHKFQVRKDGTPYVAHLLQVAGIILENGGTENQAIAGLLHDAIEDVGVTAEEIESRFGSEVAAMVVAVSEDKSVPKDQRKMEYAKVVRKMSKNAALVSCADKLHNGRCYVQGFKTNNDDHLIDRALLEFYQALFVSYHIRLDDAIDGMLFELDGIISQMKEAVAFSEEVNQRRLTWTIMRLAEELKAKYPQD